MIFLKAWPNDDRLGLVGWNLQWIRIVDSYREIWIPNCHPHRMKMEKAIKEHPSSLYTLNR